MVDFAEFKRFFLFNMVGSLIICALIAVVSILVGSFGYVAQKSLTTLFMIVIHSLIALAFIWDNEKQGTFNRLSFFINTIFILIILSFLTSIFGIWGLIPGQVGHCYMTYFVIAFAALHADILSKALHLEDYLDGIIYLNYVFMVGVVGMLIPVIFIQNAALVLEPIYFRFLAALGVLDGTLSILTIIFYKLHLIKHPRTDNQLGYIPSDVAQTQLAHGQSLDSSKVKKKGLSVWVWILIVYLVFQILGALMGGFFFRNIF